MQLHELVFEEIGLDTGGYGHRPKKFKCPSCGQKRFVRYVDLRTGEYLPDIYGRCDREHGCTYLLTPHEDIKLAKKALRDTGQYAPPERPVYQLPQGPPREIKYCNRELMIQTQDPEGYLLQPLYWWFLGKFGAHATNDLFRLYNVGTSKDGSTLFWQVDIRYQVRTCQKIKYTGFNRDKQIPPIRLFKTGDDYEPCFFGEHLLAICKTQDIDPLVCIVESEKTAMVASLYLPTVETKTGLRTAVWVASGGSNGITDGKMSVLRDYDVMLVPDFSYLNRAQWGALPMRKAYRVFTVGNPPREVSRQVADPEGDVDGLYQSSRTKILTHAKARHCTVFDPVPDREDSGDIADYLVESGDREVAYDDPGPYFRKGPVSALVEPLRSEVLFVSHEEPEFFPPELEYGQIGYDKQQLNKMIEKNPALGNLIGVLNLKPDGVFIT